MIFPNKKKSSGSIRCLIPYLAARIQFLLTAAVGLAVILIPIDSVIKRTVIKQMVYVEKSEIVLKGTFNTNNLLHHLIGGWTPFKFCKASCKCVQM